MRILVGHRVGRGESAGSGVVPPRGVVVPTQPAERLPRLAGVQVAVGGERPADGVWRFMLKVSAGHSSY